MTTPTTTRRTRQGFRRASRVAWLVMCALVNLVFLVWWFSGVFLRAMRGCESLVGSDKVACESANGGTPAATVIVLWVAADLALIAIWWLTRRKSHSIEPPARPDA